MSGTFREALMERELKEVSGTFREALLEKGSKDVSGTSEGGCDAKGWGKCLTLDEVL
ncbi:hypothetical protein [Pseudalkalibacillus sp. SCS-8]|uniref:hypothetical protein n=1 Tax=Pseudalkalibacillus nanhaiensis TaxID=3115291 RepID=UPI0032DBA688